VWLGRTSQEPETDIPQRWSWGHLPVTIIARETHYHCQRRMAAMGHAALCATDRRRFGRKWRSGRRGTRSRGADSGVTIKHTARRRQPPRLRQPRSEPELPQTQDGDKTPNTERHGSRRLPEAEALHDAGRGNTASKEFRMNRFHKPSKGFCLGVVIASNRVSVIKANRVNFGTVRFTLLIAEPKPRVRPEGSLSCYRQADSCLEHMTLVFPESPSTWLYLLVQERIGEHRIMGRRLRTEQMGIVRRSYARQLQMSEKPPARRSIREPMQHACCERTRETCHSRATEGEGRGVTPTSVARQAGIRKDVPSPRKVAVVSVYPASALLLRSAFPRKGLTGSDWISKLSGVVGEARMSETRTGHDQGVMTRALQLGALNTAPECGGMAVLTLCYASLHPHWVFVSDQALLHSDYESVRWNYRTLPDAFHTASECQQSGDSMFLSHATRQLEAHRCDAETQVGHTLPSHDWYAPRLATPSTGLRAYVCVERVCPSPQGTSHPDPVVMVPDLMCVQSWGDFHLQTKNWQSRRRFKEAKDERRKREGLGGRQREGGVSEMSPWALRFAATDNTPGWLNVERDTETRSTGARLCRLRRRETEERTGIWNPEPWKDVVVAHGPVPPGDTTLFIID
ncbi:hypothetical protein P4O66_014239, partial [Electrophorus voltai]